MSSSPARPDLKLRLWLGDQIALGPGKAELLAAVAEQGSISASAKALGMSYRRAWLLVDTMNRCFREPLVSTGVGGKGGGGARLTPSGEQVLATYRALLVQLQREADAGLSSLLPLLRDAPLPPHPEA